MIVTPLSVTIVWPALLSSTLPPSAEADNPVSYTLAFVAMVFGAMNVVGGYVVTDRMLQMFRKKPTALKATTEGADSAPGA